MHDVWQATMTTSAVKLAGIVGGLGMFAVESMTEQPDLVRYAITQGGLLAVVLVLLWSYRRDWTNIVDQRGEHIAVLTNLVQQSTTAQANSAASLASMAEAIKEMTRTVGQISQRRHD